MHSQLIFNAYFSSFNRNKRKAVTPGITGETISSSRRPVLFGSRALCEIDLPRCSEKFGLEKPGHFSFVHMRTICT